MELERMIRELRAELELLDTIIANLERLAQMQNRSGKRARAEEDLDLNAAVAGS
ncbi:MAG TPA: hypothetical protein VGF59_12035 [Bryobacteraceae bacterium]|jgi:hypothetical protein